MDDFFCADHTRETGEPIYGTASQVNTWFLLEYRLAWREKATTDNDLPAEVQAFLNRQLADIPGSRLLFIKNNSQRDFFRLYVVRSDEISPQLYELPIGRYEDLLELDWKGLSAGQAQFSHYLRERPIYLVCTNGRRDKCCARYGLPMVDTLNDIAGDDVWQASHMGGHRYAPNVVVYPSCVNYGLLEPIQSRVTVEATEKGKIFDLAFFRGRNYYDPPVQAADYFLRRELNLLGFSDLLLVGVKEMDEQNSAITFQTPGAKRYNLGIRQQRIDDPRFVSCSTPKAKPVSRYSLTNLWDEGKKVN